MTRRSKRHVIQQFVVPLRLRCFFIILASPSLAALVALLHRNFLRSSRPLDLQETPADLIFLDIEKPNAFLDAGVNHQVRKSQSDNSNPERRFVHPFDVDAGFRQKDFIELAAVIHAELVLL